jgi:hypothetical protein
MKQKREKDWYNIRGVMQLFKNDKLIREFRFHNAHRRRAILKIWNSEVKPNGIDTYELIIKLED